jgi:hypothetical protein
MRVTSSSPLGSAATTAVADAAGRLHLDVDLGPPVPTTAVIGVPTIPPVAAPVTIAPA